jgi:methylmalonyl-CoA mutase cobalamin-binding subunit
MDMDMDRTGKRLREKLVQLSREWMITGLPSRQGLEAAADDLLRWKAAQKAQSAWAVPPLLLTATLDDGLGQGLQIIHRYAQLMGMRIVPLGLLQTPEAIVAACRRHRPDFLGLTVLQLDSDDDLCQVGHSLDARTCLIAGGPVFKFDPELAQRCNVGFVARDVACFIDFLLKWSPRAMKTARGTTF